MSYSRTNKSWYVFVLEVLTMALKVGIGEKEHCVTFSNCQKHPRFHILEADSAR